MSDFYMKLNFSDSGPLFFSSSRFGIIVGVVHIHSVKLWELILLLPHS